MLEESRGYLPSFMVKCVYEQESLPRPSVPYFFADVMESINGRRDPLPAVGVKQHICMMVTWLQFPSNTNVTYNVHKAVAKGIAERTR